MFVGGTFTINRISSIFKVTIDQRAVQLCVSLFYIVRIFNSLSTLKRMLSKRKQTLR
uniref:Uncharacterized protein n=1 Tax=Staphylococcus arlettae TaxID=29378 RepID=A0A1W5QH24_9STAP|nr:hypothetical protein [Staphylococcus arlettae]